jgi:hypothetical protein
MEFTNFESPVISELGSFRPTNGSALFLAELKEGGVLGGSGLPVTRSGKVFIKQLTHNSLRLVNCPIYQEKASITLANEKQIAVSVDEEKKYFGPHLLLGSNKNFGHWLLNHFSRLMLVKDRRDLMSIPVVVNDDFSRVGLECLMKLGYREEQIVRVPPGQIAWFESLWVPSFPYFGAPETETIVWTPQVIHFVRQALGIASERPDAKPPRRLFITRRNEKWRRLKNEDDVLSAVQHLGFERMDPGQFSIEDQIKLASEADIIMGPMGAGMGLQFFAPKRTHIIELKLNLPGGEMDIHPAIAAVIGQQHHTVLGSSDDPKGVHLDSDFVVSADEVASLATQCARNS